MLTISFMTTLGVNVGDEFIREGIRAILDHAGIHYTPLYVNKHDRASLHEPREDETQIVADKFWDSDVFIQSGAPVYWHLYGGKHTSLNSEWSDWLWRDRILNRERKGPLFLNLGAGSCQSWNDGGDAFLNDAACRDFALRAGRRALLTTVRDSVASGILTAAQVPHRPLPCPAFLAGSRHRIPATSGDIIGVNLMPLAAHYDVIGNFDRAHWTRQCELLCRLLRASGRLVFIAHDAAERDYMRAFAASEERIFFASAWRDYLDIYAGCAAVVANRVHGVVCAAGFGIPGIIIGNDTRALIGQYIGLSVFGAVDINPEIVASKAATLLLNRDAHQRQLLALRDTTLQTYADLVRDQLGTASPPAR